MSASFAAKARLADLAMFGGPPLFATPRPMGQLSAPPVDDFLARIRQACEDRCLTNNGPLARELERRLADFHQVPHCVAVANAGLGLSMLMRILAAGRRGRVIMPAYSFRGLPHFAAWAQQTPCFCDVDAHRHTLDPACVERAATADTSCILAVGSCHDAGDIAGLETVARRHDIPLVFDSVYRAGATADGRPAGSSGRAEVFSLHASKLINGFEGGYVTTHDPHLARLLRWQRNFCYPGPETLDLEDQVHVIGLNAKLNEFHAAMALSSLDHLDVVIARNRARLEAWRQALSGLPGLALPEYPPDQANPHQMPLLEVTPPWPLDRDAMVTLLRAEGAAIHAHYSPILPRAYSGGILPFPVPVAEGLAGRFLQLPAGDHVSSQDIAALGGLFRFLAEHGRAVAAHLAELKA